MNEINRTCRCGSSNIQTTIECETCGRHLIDSNEEQEVIDKIGIALLDLDLTQLEAVLEVVLNPDCFLE